MRKLIPFAGVILAASLILLGWQVFSTPASLIQLVIGVLICLTVNQRQSNGKKKNRSLLFIGVTLIVISLASKQAFWLVIFLLLVGLIIFMPRVTDQSDLLFWRRKQYVAPRINSHSEVNEHLQVKKNQWWGDQSIGSQVYQWDDINLKKFGGDTIIDLGNTLLPVDRENIVMIQKGFGDTRILVPFGTGVYLEHSTFMGRVVFSDQPEIGLKNETITIKTPEYAHRERRIRIVTSCLMGDVEVVFV